MATNNFLSRINLFKLFTSQSMPRAKPFAEMGASGTRVYGGYLFSAEKSSAWSGQQKYKTSADIAANVSIVAASLHYFLNLVARPQWTVRPADEDSAEAQELAEFMQDVIESMNTPWPRVVRKAGMFKFHGFGIHEWIAVRREDGGIGYKDVEARPQFTIEQWDLDERGTVQGVFQRSPQSAELLGIPRSKMVYLVDDLLTDSPEGQGLFRHMAEPYNRLKVYLDLETRTFERDLRGIPIGRVPYSEINAAVADGSLSKEEAQNLVQGMEDFVQATVKKSDTGITLDSKPYESTAADGLKVSSVMQWGLELLQGTANGLPELSKAIDRLQREMARIIGTESLMMGDQGGNRALAVDKSRNLYLIANSVKNDIVAGFDKDLIDPIWKLNGFPEDLRPSFFAEDVAFKDVEMITAAIKDMATSGAVLSPTDPVIDDVRDLLGVSRAEPFEEMEEEEVPEPEPEDLEEDIEEDDEDEELPDDDDSQKRVIRRRLSG